MATYKVPQDVEADDKLIGPFSFRQFIYLIIVAIAGFIAWALGQIFIGLAIIPLPIIIFFGALALPLRKDQPMEMYLAAIVSFYLKPRNRVWDPEGIESFITISAPKTVEARRTKDLSESEAEQRLGYLANIVDSGGWAIRGSNTAPQSAMITDVFYDAQNTPDILDENNSVAQSFSYLMGQSAEKSREQTISMMKQAAAESARQNTATQQPATSPAPIPAPTPTQEPAPAPAHEKVIQPLNSPAAINQPTAIMTEIEKLTNPVAAPNAYAPPPNPNPAAAPTPTAAPVVKENPSTTSDTPVPADIMNLAKNSDGLSVSTISKEANRLKSRSASQEDEVVISLR